MTGLQRVLVTGGAGYIGSHTCKTLAARGIEPIVFDNLSRGHASAVRWGELIRGEITDYDSLLAALRKTRPLGVIHFAALAYVGESVVAPAPYYGNNIVGTLTLLNAMRAADIDKVVFSSSCATYGVPQSLPIREGAPQYPISPYGRSKLIGEQMLADMDRAYGLRFAALRYFNAAGADPEGEIGERHDPETHLIPRALMAAAGQIAQLDVFGDDHATPDGTCIRDYIHVSDLAEAHVRALDHVLAGRPSVMLNIGTGRGISVLEVLAAAGRVTGRPVPMRVLARREGDPPAVWADPTLAREVLGFQARYSDLDTIIRTAWSFMQSCL